MTTVVLRNQPVGHSLLPSSASFLPTVSSSSTRPIISRASDIRFTAPPERSRSALLLRFLLYPPQTSAVHEMLRAKEQSVIWMIPKILIRLDNMIQRYEEPNSMVRWDAPLFTVLADDTLSTSNGSESPLGEQIWRAVTAGDVKPPNGAALSQAKAPTDALFNLENTTLGIVTNIMAEQAASGALGGPVILTLTPAVPDAPKSKGGLKIQITLPQRNITLSELQRLKRQFVTIQKKAITLGTTERGTVDWTEDGVAERFGSFLEEHLKA